MFDVIGEGCERDIPSVDLVIHKIAMANIELQEVKKCIVDALSEPRRPGDAKKLRASLLVLESIQKRAANLHVLLTGTLEGLSKE